MERLRIAAGIPIAGRDVTPENLPQEVGRDAQAISFVKGCYLGQETVARIDALGHVNRHLCGLRIASASQSITPGARIEAAGKAVGHVTSVTESTAAGEFLALGYLRTSHSAPGSSVSIVTSAPDGSESRAEAVVVALPMEPN
ncbi:MAG: folate-binding protein YgfZ [Isosphaeraceae bacterium]